ncbi:MAG TPA: hypothetical protein PLO68_09125, partial [Sedimentisphaerales bacterium]|nr:hypothetical protein [Sedimentisphaerales bacterium]
RGMGRLGENCVLNIKNKSHSVTAEIVVPERGAEGVIISQGANIGGWSLYCRDGKLRYCYNWGGLKHFIVGSREAIPAGRHQVRMEFAYAGGGLGKGTTVSLFVNGKKAGQGRVEATGWVGKYSPDETFDIGEDSGSPVSNEYSSPNRFTGTIRKIVIDSQPTNLTAADQENLEDARRQAALAMQ